MPKKIFKLRIIYLSFLFFNNTAFAVEPDAGTMLQNFAQTVPQLMSLVTALAYVMGMFLIFKGIVELKQIGESRTQMSREHSINGPLLLVFVGTLLLYLPSSVQVGASTFWTSTTPFAYVVSTGDQWSQIINDAYLIIELIGTIAFIRGLLMLSTVSERGVHGQFGKAITYIIAGVLCINFHLFLHTINTTLSLGQT